MRFIGIVLFLGLTIVTGCRKSKSSAQIDFINLSSGPVTVYYTVEATGEQLAKTIGKMNDATFKEFSVNTDDLNAAPYKFFKPDSIVNNTNQKYDSSAYTDLLNWQGGRNTGTYNSSTKSKYVFTIIDHHFN